MRGRRGAGREAAGKRRRKKIEGHLKFSGARRHFKMKRIHIHVVAPPGNGLSARGEFQTREVDDRSGWSVFAGNPLWINQRQRPGRNRDRHVRMKKFARRFRGVNGQRDEWWRRADELSGVDEPGRKDNERRREQYDPKSILHIRLRVFWKKT